MDIDVRARNVEVSDSLRHMTLDRIRRLARVLAMDRAEVCFSEARNPRISEPERCEIVLFGHGHILRAAADASDPAVAADRVADKMQHRLEKLAGQLGGRRDARRRGSVHFRSYHHAGSPHDLDATADAPCWQGAQLPAGRSAVVETRAPHTKPMTPEEAALEMAHLSYEFYFFINTETERGAVVFRRNDGNVGVIDMAGGGS